LHHDFTARRAGPLGTQGLPMAKQRTASGMKNFRSVSFIPVAIFGLHDLTLFPKDAAPRPVPELHLCPLLLQVPCHAPETME
jgi:hypothetical protein